MSKYTQHAIKQQPVERVNWWDDQSVFPGVTKNGLIFAAALAIIAIAGYCLLNWDLIITASFY